jgi:hypothetical protein
VGARPATAPRRLPPRPRRALPHPRRVAARRVGGGGARGRGGGGGGDSRGGGRGGRGSSEGRGKQIMPLGLPKLCRSGTYPKLYAPMLAKVPKNTATVPKIACSDAGESTQITVKVPKITYTKGIIRLPLSKGHPGEAHAEENPRPREVQPPLRRARQRGGGCTRCIQLSHIAWNRSTCQVQPFYLSSETVLPVKRNRSTYQTVHLSNRSTFQVKPFYLSGETVLPIK